MTVAAAGANFGAGTAAVNPDFGPGNDSKGCLDPSALCHPPDPNSELLLSANDSWYKVDRAKSSFRQSDLTRLCEPRNDGPS
jgi:hypothetical protein